MHISKLRKVLLLTSITSALAACGGSGSTPLFTSAATPTTSTTPTTPTPTVPTTMAVAGKVLDGPVQGAKVYLDTNDNHVIDATDQTCANCLTDAAGAFNFPGVPIANTHAFLANGGVDSFTGAKMVGMLMAPPGATTVTPLTSLVVANLPAGPISAAAATSANNAVVASLGLPANTMLATTDPTASGHAAILAAETAVQGMLSQVANSVAVAGGNAPGLADAAYEAALMSIASAAKAGTIGSVNLMTPTTAGTLVNAAITAAVRDPAVVALATPPFVSDVSLHMLVGAPIAAEVVSMATAATSTAIAAAAARAVSDSTVIGNTIALLATALTPINGTAANQINLNTVSTAIVTAAATAGATPTTIATAISTAAPAALLTTAGVTAAQLAAAANLNNVFTQSAITINTAATINTAVGGAVTVPVTTPGAPGYATLSTATVTLTPVGTPVAGTPVDVGVSIADATGNNLQLLIKGVTATVTAGALILDESTATVYAYKMTSGAAANATIIHPVKNSLLSTTAGAGTVLTLKIQALMTALNAQSAFFPAAINLNQGSYTVGMAMTGLPLGDNATTPSAYVSVAVPGTSSTPSTLGQGDKLTVTVQ